MPTPTWLGATTGRFANPGQVNQFLGTHISGWLYSGRQLTAQQTTGIATYQSTTTQSLGQAFTTGTTQTAVGQVTVQISAVGGSPVTQVIGPLVVGLWGDIGGVPDPTVVLASTTLLETTVYTAPFWVPVPLAAPVTSSTQYWLVVSTVGTGTSYYAWQESNQPSGAASSLDGGVTWTEQTYGLMYQIYDQTPGGNVTYIYDDDGARWIQLAYNTLNQLTGVTEYAVSQDGTLFTSTRAITYASNTPTVVS